METYRQLSFAAFLLSRTDPRHISLYDYDTVEEKNMGGQLYRFDDIGSKKVYAISDMIVKYSNKHCSAYPTLYNLERGYSAYVTVCGFDNMQARKDAFDKWRANNVNHPFCVPKKALFIDGRMAAEYLQVFCIRGDDTYNIEKYKNEFLFDDTEAEETPCNYKQTSFMSAIIGGIITNLFVNFCHNCLVQEGKVPMERELPFLTTYDAATMMFTTEY